MYMKFAQSSLIALTLGLATPALAQDLSEDVSDAVGAAETAGVTDMIVNGDEVTVFVPSNEALSAAPQEELNALMEDTDQLASVIQGYAVSGTVMAEDVIQMAEDAGGSTNVETLGGGSLMVEVDGDTVMVGPEGGPMTTVVDTDLQVGNVTMHVIDTAFMPDTGM
ncbi:fasciclin domain-containing protein [Palleronia aestuarii]|nr:fasciclin domain-containing protein [Palleronia aestuarii]